VLQCHRDRRLALPIGFHLMFATYVSSACAVTHAVLRSLGPPNAVSSHARTGCPIRTESAEADTMPNGVTRGGNGTTDVVRVPQPATVPNCSRGGPELPCASPPRSGRRTPRASSRCSPTVLNRGLPEASKARCMLPVRLLVDPSLDTRTALGRLIIAARHASMQPLCPAPMPHQRRTPAAITSIAGRAARNAIARRGGS
jgi:hypothetical protein